MPKIRSPATNFRQETSCQDARGLPRFFSFNFIDENKKEAQVLARRGATLEAFLRKLNMDLVSVSPVFNLYDETLADPYLPAPVIRRPKFVFAENRDALGRARSIRWYPRGCIVSGGSVQSCVSVAGTCALKLVQAKWNPAFFSRTPNVVRAVAKSRRAILDRGRPPFPREQHIGYGRRSQIAKRYFRNRKRAIP